MPQLTLKQLLRSKAYGVEPIEHQSTDGMFGSGIGKMVKDVVQADLSKGGPRVEFYKNLPSLYSTSLPLIESQGSIDIGRTKAVASAHYNGDNGSVLGMGKILSLGNLLGGSANRPSDTIFPHELRDASPPVSINGQPISGDWSGLKYAVEARVNYDVSTQPAGTNILTGLLKGTPEDIAKKAVGAATDALKNKVRSLAIGALTSKRKRAANALKDSADSKNKPLSHDLNNTYEKQGSKFYKSSGKNDMLGIQLMERAKGNINSADDIINDINFTKVHEPNTVGLEMLLNLNKKTKLQYIQFKIVGQPNYLIFPAAISDISEHITPEIGDFKYVGSPFKVYRYNGVERTLKFDFQVYWLDNGQQEIMEFKLDALRKLSFPNENLTTIELADKTYTPLVFSPNLIEVTIGDLYKNLKGMVSNLSISVPQKTTWATSSPDFNQSTNSFVYPNVVDVSFEMKIIETHNIEQNGTIAYRFTKTTKTEEKPTIANQSNDFANGEGYNVGTGYTI